MYDPTAVDDFVRRLAEKVRYLRTYGPTLPRRSTQLAEAVIHDLEQSAEELRVTGEELQLQNEQLAAALRRLEVERASFRRLFELAPVACLVTDHRGSVVDANRAAVRLLDVGGTVGPGRSFATFLTPESVRDFRAALARFGRVEAVKDLKLHVRSRSGGTVPVSARATSLRPGDDEPRLLWALVEPTDTGSARREAAQQPSWKAPEPWTDYVTFLAGAIAELGSESEEGSLARTAARLTGEALGEFCVVYLVAENGAVLREVAGLGGRSVRSRGRRESEEGDGAGPPGLWELLSSRVPAFGTPGDGSALDALLDHERSGLPRKSRPAGLCAVPIDAREQPVGLIFAVSTGDPARLESHFPVLQALASSVGAAVANLRLLGYAEERRAAAEELTRGWRRALAGLSHELRTPLQSILGYTELLLDGIPEPVPAKSQGFVRSIRASALLQVELVNEILSLVRPREGTVPLDLAVVRLEDVMRQCADMVRESARARDLFVRLEVEGDLAVRTDRAKLSQILINLLMNAVKFTPRGGVTAAATREGSAVVIEVRDTGHGIPARELPYIFEPFWQGSAAEGTSEGAGLGLALVNNLVARLGGEVDVRTREGEGTTFRISLPGAA